MKKAKRNLFLIFIFLFYCDKNEYSSTFLITIDEYRNAELKRITSSDPSYKNRWPTMKKTELWVKGTDTIAFGTYNEGLPFNGNFLIPEILPQDTVFRFEMYEKGNLLGTAIPDWEYPKLGSLDIVPFTFKRLRHFACSYDDTGYVGEIDSVNDFFLQKGEVPSFLNLTCRMQFRKAYRFYYLPTWEKPIIFDICLESDSIKPFISVKRLDGSGGFRHLIKAIELDTLVYMNKMLVFKLDSLFEHSAIWKADLEYQYSCGDGKTWKIEGLKKGIYAYRSYWCMAPKIIHDIFAILKEEFGIEEKQRARAKNLE